MGAAGGFPTGAPVASPKNPLIQFKPTRCVGPRVQVAARRRDVGVAERRLHLGEGAATVERVRTVGVAQPCSRERILPI